LVELDKKNIEQKLFSSDYKFEDSSVFKELMNLYPWCSTFTVVYLKSLSLTNDMRFQKELEKYAIQLNSREVIYELLHNVTPDNDTVEFTEEVDAIKSNTNADNKDEEPQEALNVNKDDGLNVYDELEKLIVSNVISDNIVNEIEETKAETKKSDEIEVHSVSNATDILEDVENDFDDSPKSFNDWLRQGEKNTDALAKKEYLTFEKPKINFFNPQSSAKKSITKKNLPVSETLAKVFESQGNYPLAISTYEQLILIFPEKKIFFADQIEKIKSKII
jgi:tetratricopeptide (TPR) repeat protein